MKKFTKGMLIAAGIFGAVGIGLPVVLWEPVCRN